MASTAIKPEGRMSLLEVGIERIQHSSSSINILTCGDGDLSYSLALVKNLVTKNLQRSKIRVIATCFLQGDELNKTHPEAESNQRAIEALYCEVKTGVDATKLHELFEPQYFHRIVWNFPQHPGNF